MNKTYLNTQKNRTHYNQRYSEVNIQGVINKINHLDHFLKDVTTTDTSWLCMYYNSFAEQLKEKKVLELGCGDCTNAAVMAALGAEVWANDISEKSGEIISKLNQNINFTHPIRFIEGNFLDSIIAEKDFDIVVGKAFVHHLNHQQEEQFLKKIVAILKSDGMVRYVEPAINSKLLDKVRWMIPVAGRPSSLQSKKFMAWQEADPHPDRMNSSAHYENIGLHYFEKVDILLVGVLERFHRFFPKVSWNRKYRRFAFKLENYLPKFINYYFARTQAITYRYPKNED